MKNKKINFEITILGTIEESVEGVAGPIVVVKDNYDNKTIFDLSEADVKKIAHHLYEDVSVYFDAIFSFMNSDTVAQESEGTIVRQGSSEKDPRCTCKSKDASGQSLIGGYARCPVHDPNMMKHFPKQDESPKDWGY